MAKKQLPFYKQLSEFVAKGMFMLDNQSIQEVKQFLLSLQHENGGFTDRAGKSDLYYSLFAHFILKNFQDAEYSNKLLEFVNSSAGKKNLNLVDRCCIAILNKDVKGSKIQNIRNIFSVLKHFIGGSYDGSLSYKYFLVFLTLDAFGFNNRITRFFARMIARTPSITENMPCSALAAQMIFRKQLKYDVSREAKWLMRYFDDRTGFKAFPSTPNADLLSVAVALTALKVCRFEVALYAPSCMDFLEKNYAEGAFLSGDGDEHRDTEYTFYGLLTLGVLV